MIDYNKNFNQVSHFVIDAERAEQRIDNFLLGLLKTVPRSLVYRIIRAGEVRVNKGRVQASYRLQAGDSVRVPPVKLAAKPVNANKSISDHMIQVIEEAVLYEDERLLAINKPSGLAVHGGSGINLGLIEIVRRCRPHAQNWELVHRLDRETSGCLLIAKKRSCLRQLHTLFRENGVQKTYLTLMKGPLSFNSKLVDVPLIKNQLQSGERIVKVSDQGKSAQSRFKVVTNFAEASLLEVAIYTGRTHQIRVHAAHIGAPIASDEKYGDREFNRLMRQKGCKRLFLHAQSLVFCLEAGENLLIKAPLPQSLEQILLKL